MKNIEITTTTGEKVILRVPTTLPTIERAAELHEVWDEHVILRRKGDWRGPVCACVPENLAADVAEAMNFFGAPVDQAGVNSLGQYWFKSDGYRAHGY